MLASIIDVIYDKSTLFFEFKYECLFFFLKERNMNVDEEHYG